MKTLITSRRVLLCVGCVGLQWGLIWTKSLALLLIPLLLFALGWALCRRQFIFALVLVLGSPLLPSFMRGLLDWGTPRAHLLTMGNMSRRRASIDPETRLGVGSWGCIVYGHEWVTQTPYNLGIRLMTALRGFTPGTYDGPMPTAKEAQAALANAVAIDVAMLERDRVTVGAETVRLSGGLGLGLTRACGSAEVHRATIWQARVLLIEIQQWPDIARAGQIIAVDTRTGLPFRYIPGEASCRELPWIHAQAF